MITPRSITLGVTLALLAGCSAPPPPPAPPKVVRVQQVDAGETAVARRVYSGELRPRIETTLGFQVGGKIVERLVNMGDHVRAGQALARLDPSDTRLTAVEAEAKRSLAVAEAQRYRDLHQRAFVSKAALDARETNLQAADAQASLARNQARYTTLVAERAGVIGPVQADVGQVVTPGQPVFRMAPDGDREILVAVPETELAQFRVGLRAEVSIFALPDQKFTGTVREISPVADPATRTFSVRVRMAGVEKLPTGLTATVRFPELGAKAADHGAISIPLSAIYQKDGKAAVWLVDRANLVHLAPVEIVRFGNEFAVIGSGLKHGDTLVIAGVNSLSSGQSVRPMPAHPAKP